MVQYGAVYLEYVLHGQHNINSSINVYFIEIIIPELWVLPLVFSHACYEHKHTVKM